MKCTNCRAADVAFERVVQPLSQSLPDVVIDGIERGACPNCGEGFTSLWRAKPLFDLISGELIAKRWRLAPGEIRFLRGQLGMRAEVLADTLGVTASQLSRWENAAHKGGKPVQMSPTGDRLLRLLVAEHLGLKRPDLRGIDTSRSEALAMKIVRKRSGWKVVDSEVWR